MVSYCSFASRSPTSPSSAFLISSPLPVDVGEEAIEPYERDQGPEAGTQHLRRRERRSPHPRGQGNLISLPLLRFDLCWNLIGTAIDCG